MRKTVLTFGLLSGAVVALLTSILLPLCMRGGVDLRWGELIGYSAMVLAFLFVFFGVRSYRERTGGALTFGRAFRVGILIVLVSSTFYVVAWEIVYFGGIWPDFMTDYSEHHVARLEAKGASAEEVAAERAKMARLAELYENPFFNAGVTFLEVFPVGLVVALVSAAILRRRGAPEPAAAG
jgi:hypothetical protein